MTDAALVARYPFLPGASELLSELKPSLEELVTDPTYETVRHLAREEVLSALSPGRGEGAPGSAAFDAARPEERVLSFLYARMLVAAAPSTQKVARRWCDGVARRAGDEMARAEVPDTELSTLAETLELEFSPLPGGRHHFAFSLPSYVSLSAALRDERFRLARQDLKEGDVEVERGLAVELLQEGIREYLLDSMASLRLEPELETSLKDHEEEVLARIRGLVPTFASGGFGVAVRPELFPPCMREIRQLLERGQNVSHASRFALASFMHKVGSEPEAIVDAYRGAPNFKEGITRYQVTQITQHDGGGGYTPPDCATMASNGICFREKDDLRPSPCADPSRVKNPLNYYRIRTRPLARTQGPGAPTTGGDPSSVSQDPEAPRDPSESEASATSSGPSSTPSPDPR